MTEPNGRTWEVRRRWVPRLGDETLWGRARRHVHGYYRRLGKFSDADPGGCANVGADDLVAVLLVLAAIVAFFLLGLPLLIALFDVLLLLLIALAGIVGRLLFRRPRVIEARSGETVHHWRISGWRASSQQIDEVKRALAHGQVSGSSRM